MSDELQQLPTSLSPALPQRSLWGRCFLNPWNDYLFIGGGLSLLVIPFVLAFPATTPTDYSLRLVIFLVLNYAHFAASTVRFYTKQGVAQAHWFMAYVAPLLAFAAVTAGVLWPKQIGQPMNALMLTWSPYHYAAQAYGLAVIYCHRSNVKLTLLDKRLMWWVAMLPFVRAFLLASNGGGLEWVVSAETLAAHPMAIPLRDAVANALACAMFVLPLWLAWRIRFPVISGLLLICNGVWWFFLVYNDAWFWATIFHSIQYLVIVLIVHVQDEKRRNTTHPRSSLLHVARFYFASWLLGGVLFLLIPLAYAWAGIGFEQATQTVWAAVNIHHFIIDGYIWRSPKPLAPNAARPV